MGLDQSVLRWFVEHREPWLTTLMRSLTVLGGSAFLIPLVLVVGTQYWRRRGVPRPLTLLAVAYGGAYLLSQAIKLLTARARPPADLALTGYAGFSFPSGHATQAAAVYGMLAVVLTAAMPRGRRRGYWAGAASIVTAVGITRCYLAAHWLTDVLAGWMLGSLWVVVVVFTARGAGPRSSGSPRDRGRPVPEGLRGPRGIRPGRRR
jgi:membrane-associated phospholipid phosphatase